MVHFWWQTCCQDAKAKYHNAARKRKDLIKTVQMSKQDDLL